MDYSYSIDAGKAQVIRDFAGHPENTGKSKRAIARELDVPESAVRRALSLPTNSEVCIMAGTATTLRPMSRAEAMQTCKAIVSHIDSARKLILDLHDRQGWRALGYDSWRECVTKEFDASKSNLYRQLEAAKIERDIEIPIGSEPVSHLAPLAKIPPAERAEAWQEAVNSAPNGEVTAAHVEAIAKRRSTQVDNPKRIAESVIPNLGISEPNKADHSPAQLTHSPAGATPDFEGEIAPPPRPPTDEEWLTSLPVRSKLNDRCRAVFDGDALAYRRVAEAPEMATLAKLVKSMARKIKHDPTRGEYLYRAGLFLDIPHPRSWLACGQCEGVGCDTCWRRGYAVAH